MITDTAHSRMSIICGLLYTAKQFYKLEKIVNKITAGCFKVFYCNKIWPWLALDFNKEQMQSPSDRKPHQNIGYYVKTCCHYNSLSLLCIFNVFLKFLPFIYYDVFISCSLTCSYIYDRFDSLSMYSKPHYETWQRLRKLEQNTKHIYFRCQK